MKTKINAVATISATIIRADGTREDLGVISQETLSSKLFKKIKDKIRWPQ